MAFLSIAVFQKKYAIRLKDSVKMVMMYIFAITALQRMGIVVAMLMIKY